MGSPLTPRDAPPPQPAIRNGSSRQQQPLDSSELLRGARLVEISHNGEIYRLQATRLGKLILTK